VGPAAAPAQIFKHGHANLVVLSIFFHCSAKVAAKQKKCENAKKNQREKSENVKRERKNANMRFFLHWPQRTGNKFQSPNPLDREKTRVLSKVSACPCYFSMLPVHVACPS
jgi:hypothetical protein